MNRFVRCICSLGIAWGALAGAAEVPNNITLSVPAEGRTGFSLIEPSRTGVDFTNFLSDATAAINQIRLIGSGVALGDVDGDGLCDIYFCRLEGSNALYRNLGQWKFEEVAGRAGVACPNQYSTGCAWADLDGDGDLDLLVNALGGGTRCFHNDGQGHFREDESSGLLREGTGTTLALADVDGDGDLDLYVARYRTTTIRSTGLTVLTVNGRHVLRPEDRDQYEFTPAGLILEHGEVDLLYLNDGQAHFTAVPGKQGFLDEQGRPLTAEPKDWGLTAMFRDVNGDRAPDLYVCNDFWSPDRFWINTGNGTFRAASPLALRKTSTFSMGIDFADINRDGHDDFLVLDMLSRDHGRRLRQRAMAGDDVIDETVIEDRPQADRNTLQLNRGDGTYAEVAQLSGLQASDWSWAVAFVDVDLDGYEDVLITTGHGFDTQDADTEERIATMGPLPTAKIHTKLLLYPRLDVPNYAFRNNGDLTFEEVGAKWGFDLVGVSHGLALADLDNDGDLDVVVNNLKRAASLYRNESTAPRLAVSLQGEGKNQQGIGARIILRGHGLVQSQEMIAGGRYLSCDAAERVFAMPPQQGPWELEVIWRNGQRTIQTAVQPNHRYHLRQADAQVPASSAWQGPERPWFIVQQMFPRQREEMFDDFARQPLLPRSYSRLGPGLAWVDFDGDGFDDLLIAGPRGGTLGVFHNQANRSLQQIETGVPLGQAPDDQTSVLGWSTGAGTSQLLVGQSSYESLPGATGLVHSIEMRVGGVQRQKSLPQPGEGSPGPMALADVDGDGDLDLFVGGRVKPGRYPEQVASTLWLRQESDWQLAQQWMGLVSGALFTDLDADGFPELVLACEWGPIRVFHREGTLWKEWTQPLGLDRFLGWWNGVTAGDFDEDGRLDLVASNWGRNHAYHSFGDVKLYSLSLGPSVGLMEAYARGSTWLPWRDLDSLSRGFPWLRERFPNHQAFSKATLGEALGEHLAQAASAQVNWLDSTLFLNRGTNFEARPLPLQAQFAPAFGLSVADADGDGHEDLFLAQNFFAVSAHDSRSDAGRGLWLRGDGRGGLAPVPAAQSGVMLYGEQRGAAVADYDGDGRVDLAVGQAGAPTVLFRNVGGSPGLRVRLQGPSGNPTGAGASIWWEKGETKGPVREVRSGGGYWSQDSGVQVLRVPPDAERIRMRWPGGRVAERSLLGVSGELTLSWDPSRSGP